MPPADRGGDDDALAEGCHEAVDGAPPGAVLGHDHAQAEPRMSSTVCGMTGSQAAPDRWNPPITA